MKIPTFYVTCLNEWSKYASIKPSSVNEILVQPLWNNKYITTKGKSLYMENFAKLSGINCINDIICDKGLVMECHIALKIQMNDSVTSQR